MDLFLGEHPEFEEIYARAIEMMADRKELLGMLAEMMMEEDIFASLRRTNESIARKKIKKLEEEISESKKMIEERDAEIERQKAENEQQNAEMQELKAQLAAIREDGYADIASLTRGWSSR